MKRLQYFCRNYPATPYKFQFFVLFSAAGACRVLLCACRQASVHTNSLRYPRGEGGFKFTHTWVNLKTDEERRHLNCRKKSVIPQKSRITARIPHQSQIGYKSPICDSFPPGEAISHRHNKTLTPNLYRKKGCLLAAFFLLFQNDLCALEFHVKGE